MAQSDFREETMRVRTWAVLLSLGFAVVFLANPSGEYFAAQPGGVNAARDALHKLVQMRDADQAREAARVARTYPIDEIMIHYKPRSRDGWGVGVQPASIVPDSIELKIMQLARKPYPPDGLTKERTALIEMGKRVKAICEVTYHYGTTVGKADPVRWKLHTHECKEGAIELIKALEKTTPNPNEVQGAAKKINTACINCHSW
jgi:hypothetical protein